MSTLITLLPLLVTLVLVVLVLVDLVMLLVRRLHPWRTLALALNSASLLGIVSLVGIVPGSLWWAIWTLTLLLVAGVVVSCLRSLRPPVDAAAPTPPGVVSLAIEVLVLAAVLVVAVIGG